MGNLIIGAAFGYRWEQIQNWCRSVIRDVLRNNPDIKVVLILDNSIELSAIRVIRQKINEELQVCEVSEAQFEFYSHIYTDRKVPPQVERFKAYAEFLRLNRDRFENYIVLTTDVRDVVFQSNPFLLSLQSHRLYVSSEGISYINEPWSKQNLVDAFDEFVLEDFAFYEIYNVGVFSHDFDGFLNLSDMIYRMSVNRKIPIVDQAVFNYLVNTINYIVPEMYVTSNSLWAINLGTTIFAVEAGKGDISQIGIDKFNEVKLRPDPKIDFETGIVSDPDEKVPFSIVHQYDRVPALAEIINKRYA